jgi:hypothetical protein
MKLEREVIIDLLPAYFSGEASPATRRLVEDHFREDPEFEASARLAGGALESLKAAPAGLDPEKERLTLERARLVVGNPQHLSLDGHPVHPAIGVFSRSRPQDHLGTMGRLGGPRYHFVRNRYFSLAHVFSDPQAQRPRAAANQISLDCVLLFRSAFSIHIERSQDDLALQERTRCCLHHGRCRPYSMGLVPLPYMEGKTHGTMTFLCFR